MSELANYSIETDHTVLLAFKDGRRMRVPIGQLNHHLAPPDLEKVRAAIKLRRDFIRRHMPKVALLVAATGLVGLLTVGGRVVAEFMNRNPIPAPDNTGISRNMPIDTPAASPNPGGHPEVKGESAIAAASPAPTITPSTKLGKRRGRNLPHHNAVADSAPKAPAPASPAPSSTPAPTITPEPSPTPSPSSDPNSALANGNTPANQNGQVLGDSTGPGDSGSQAPLPNIP